MDDVVEQSWGDLYRATPGANPALGPDFAELIEATFRPTGQPCWIVVRRGTVPIGMVQLRRELRWLGPVPQRRVVGGLGFHGYATDVLAAPPEAGTVADAVADVLLSWSLGSALHCWRIPMEGALASASRLGPLMEPTSADPVVRHGATARRLEGKPGANQRRLLRQLEALGSINIRHASDPEENSQLARHFTRMHSRLKREQGQLPVFDLSPGAHERFPEHWAEYCRRGAGSALVLTLDGKPVAISLQLHGAWTSASWRVARDPSLSRYSLGLAMMDEAIELSRHRGDLAYHLGPGDERYKQLWVPAPDRCLRLRALAPGLRSLPARLYGRLSGRAIT